MSKPVTHKEDPRIPPGKSLITYELATKKLTRLERFMATVYAMNGLLIAHGVYSPDEFEFQFRQWAQKELKKKPGR